MKKKQLKQAFKAVADFVPEAWPLDVKTFRANQQFMGRIDKNFPFVSEGSLYTILGKEDARSFRALLRQFAMAAGLSMEDTYGL